MARSFQRTAGPILCCLAATAACGSEEEPRAASMTPEELYREIEAIREARPQEQAFRLSPLRAGDWNAALGSPVCSFATQSGVLLMADASKAVARIAGRPMTLRAAGPVDASAGFYRAGALTVSVAAPRSEKPGRHRIAASLARETPWEVEGTWSCVRRG